MIVLGPTTERYGAPNTFTLDHFFDMWRHWVKSRLRQLEHMGGHLHPIEHDQATQEQGLPLQISTKCHPRDQRPHVGK